LGAVLTHGITTLIYTSAYAMLANQFMCTYPSSSPSLPSLPPSLDPTRRTTGCWAAFERRRCIVVVLATDGTLSEDCRESSVKAVVVSCRDMTRVM
jgi:hypothetical protein